MRPTASRQQATVIRISEVGHAEDGLLRVRLRVGDGPEHDLAVRDPGDTATEGNIAWYFEQHLRYPLLDRDRERLAVRQLSAYGESLFTQVFGGPAYQSYLKARDQSFANWHLEVSGSAVLHQIHWEALRDPELDRPLALRLPIARRVTTNTAHKGFAVPDVSATLNVLLVTARPNGLHDVGHRTISRPLMDALRDGGRPVTVDMVRPGTWEALRTHLDVTAERHGPGWYHIVHFDLHGIFTEYVHIEAGHLAGRLRFPTAGPPEPFAGQRGFLMFETADEGTAEPVSAHQIASLLVKHRVPVAMLNACQSAMQSASEASLAQQLAEAGVPVAVGMAYSVTVTAAAQAVPLIYSQLADGTDPATAVHAARCDLFENRARTGYFNDQIELEDWLLPVVFSRESLWTTLRPRLEAQPSPSQRPRIVDDAPAAEYEFVGRELDIQEIERRILLNTGNNILAVHGLVGVGKTALLEHLAWWWQRTGLVDLVLRFDYESHEWTYDEIITEIHAKLESSGTTDDGWRYDPPTQKQISEHIRELRAGRHLLIFDNFDSLPSASPRRSQTAHDQERINILLSQLSGGRSLVLLGSRSEPPRPDSDRGSSFNAYRLSGLDPEATSILTAQILRKHNATKYLSEQSEKAALEELVATLDGFPSAMIAVLPALASTPPSVLLSALRAGGSGREITVPIQRGIEDSFARLDPATRQSLLLLAPFTSVIATGQVIAHYQELLLEDKRVMTATTIDLDKAIAEAAKVGLIGHHPRLAGIAQPHPMLDYFLHRILQNNKSLLDAAYAAHYRVSFQIAGHIYHAINSDGSPQQRAIGLSAAQAQYANLLSAFNYAIREERPIDNLIAALNAYLDHIRQEDTQRKMLEDAITAYSSASTPNQRRELAVLHNYAGRLALHQRRLDEAEQHIQNSIDLTTGIVPDYAIAENYGILGQIAEAEGRYEDAQSAHHHVLDIYLNSGHSDGVAAAYANLGDIAYLQHRYADAEQAYSKALELRDESGYDASKTYGDLARVALAQHRYQEAEAYCWKSIEIKSRFGDITGTAAMYAALGRISQEQHTQKEAERFYRRSLDISLQYGDDLQIAANLFGIAHIAYAQRRFNEASDNFRKALDIWDKLDNRENVAGTYGWLGVIAQERGRNEEAEGYFSNALQFFLRSDDKQTIASIYGHLGDIALEQRLYEKAEAHYRQALEHSPESAPQNRAGASIRLADLYARTSRHEKAVASLLDAVVAFRRVTGSWHPEVLRRLRREGDRLGPDTFEPLVADNVPRELVAELMTAINSAEISAPGTGSQDPQVILRRTLREFDDGDLTSNFVRLGMRAQTQAQYREANTSYRKALDAYLEFGDDRRAAQSYGQLGVLAQFEDRFETAERLYREALVTLESRDQPKAALLYGRLGQLFEEERRYADAESSFQKALDIFLELGDRKGEAGAYDDMGRIARARGKFEIAEILYRKALDIYLQLKDWRHAGLGYLGLSLVAQETNRLQDAEGACRTAHGYFLKLGDRECQAMAYSQLGHIAQLQGRLGAADEFFREAEAAYAASGNQRRAAGISDFRAAIYTELGQFQNAEACCHRALQAHLEHGDRRDAGDVYGRLGVLAERQGRPEEAEGFVREALAIFTELGDTRRVAQAYRKLGDLTREQRPEEAGASYRRALDGFIEVGDPIDTAFTYVNLAQIAQIQHAFVEAENYYRAALGFFNTLGGLHSAGNVHLQLGVLARAQNRFHDAEASFHQALENFEAAGTRNGSAEAHHQLGILAQMQGQLSAAEDAYRAALQIDLELDDRRNAADACGQLGSVTRLLGRLEEAEGFYRVALGNFLERGDRRGAALVHSELGTIAREQGRFAEATTNFRAALDIVLETDDQDSASALYQQLGIIAEEAGNLEEAEINYRTSLDILRSSGSFLESVSISQLGDLLVKLGRHGEAVELLLKAATAWRISTGNWDHEDFIILSQERRYVEAEEFARLFFENVPSDLAAELLAGIDAVGDSVPSYQVGRKLPSLFTRMLAMPKRLSRSATRSRRSGRGLHS